MNLKDKRKKEKYELVRELYYNKGLSIYRWIKKASKGQNKPFTTQKKRRYCRKKKYDQKIYNRIRELKEELPQRSAPMIHRILQKEFESNCPSLSSIQRFLRENGLLYRSKRQYKGS